MSPTVGDLGTLLAAEHGEIMSGDPSEYIMKSVRRPRFARFVGGTATQDGAR